MLNGDCWFLQLMTVVTVARAGHKVDHHRLAWTPGDSFTNELTTWVVPLLQPSIVTKHQTWIQHFVIVCIVDNNFFVLHLNRFKPTVDLINTINNGSICKAYDDLITIAICAAKDTETMFYWLTNLGVSYLFDFHSILRPINNLESVGHNFYFSISLYLLQF